MMTTKESPFEIKAMSREKGLAGQLRGQKGLASCQY